MSARATTSRPAACSPLPSARLRPHHTPHTPRDADVTPYGQSHSAEHDEREKMKRERRAAVERSIERRVVRRMGQPPRDVANRLARRPALGSAQSRRKSKKGAPHEGRGRSARVKRGALLRFADCARRAVRRLLKGRAHTTSVIELG